MGMKNDQTAVRIPWKEDEGGREWSDYLQSCPTPRRGLDIWLTFTRCIRIDINVIEIVDKWKWTGPDQVDMKSIGWKSW